MNADSAASPEDGMKLHEIETLSGEGSLLPNTVKSSVKGTQAGPESAK